MTKNSPPVIPSRTKTRDSQSNKPADTKAVSNSSKTMRETVESIVIAFVLAFLFRTFEAEAFVIPTGSMAPTLQGRHKDVVCPQCGYAYRANASSEADEDVQAMQERLGDPKLTDRERAGYRTGIQNKEVVAVTCPLCHYVLRVDQETTGSEYPGYNGDRILVGKFPYEFGDPKRWDVVVFHYPGDAKVNYIKRLVGQPNETVRIYRGDIYSKHDGEPEYQLQRKPPDKLRTMMQMVYDNDYVVDDMTAKGWPVRWQPWPNSGSTGVKSDDGSRSYVTSPESAESWIRYQHIVPTSADWRALDQGHLPAAYPARPRLITDFYAYNAGIQRGNRYGETQSIGLHWVGDLMVEADIEVQGKEGSLLLDLVKGGKHFRAAIDIATGIAKLSIDGMPEFQSTGKSDVQGPGTYHVAFANADQQLLLWAGRKHWYRTDRLVAFDKETSYRDPEIQRPKSDEQDAGDLAPVGIGSQRAALKISHMQVKRDIYYIAANNTRLGPITDYDYRSDVPVNSGDELLSFLSSPRRWRSEAAAGASPFDHRGEVTFSLEKDQFFVLGDNSPFSKDSRLWEHEHWVDRELMIGKALFIYWPHSFDRIPGTKIPFPFFPNFAGMGFVR